MLDYIIKPRLKAKSTLTVGQVLDLLDSLAENKQNQKKLIFKELVRKHSYSDNIWIVRLVLKKMQLGVGHEKVLKALGLLDRFNQTSSLEEALKGSGINIFNPFKPMLASRLHLSKVEAACKENIFLAETKFDGERIQCHLKEGMVKFYTRSGNDYTHYYSALSSVISTSVSVDEAILDGEMVVYSQKENKIAKFGLNKTVALKNSADHSIMYVVFDILHCTGEECQKMPLVKRKDLLEKTIKQTPNCLEVVSTATCSSFSEIMEEFNKSRERKEEGLVIKKADSLYQCNIRNQDWIKLKADYIESIVDSFDLAIVGCYFARGSRRVVLN